MFMTNPRGASVLVAEDNAVNMEVAKFHLAGLGCAVEGVENGALAVEVLRRRAFDVVLMDCQMPVMDGFEALQHIRAQFASGNKSPALRPPVVIAVTAADDDETRRHCLAAGFDGFLSKPFSKQQLNDAMLSIGNAATSAGAFAARRTSTAQQRR